MSEPSNQSPHFTVQGHYAYLKTLVDILNSPQIDIQSLMKCLHLGLLDDAPLLREYAWKVVLKYLPRDRSKWTQEADKKEGFYRDYLEQFMPPPHSYSQNEQDCKLWIKIEKDTCRTQPDLPFFKQAAPPMHFPFRDPDHPQKYEQKPTHMHHYMARILFIHAKVNDKVGYAQGMNQILAPIFYVLHRVHSETIQQAACFFMFLQVLADVYSFHIRMFEDSQEREFRDRVSKISRMLYVVDRDILLKLQEQGIDPMFYLFRWITLFFAQEFPISITLRIWDSIFAYNDRNAFVNALSVALLQSSKQQIANSSFVEVLQCLKNMSGHVHIEEVIIKAREYCESEPSRWGGRQLEEEEERDDEQAEGQVKGDKDEESWFQNLFKIKKFW